MTQHSWRGLALALVAIALLVFAGTAARAQSGGTIRLILPFPPGGPADVMARLLAQQIGASGGPTMVVESHPGATTEIGTELVSRAAPDGNTLEIMSNSFIVLPHLRKLKYDPLTSFEPICELASFPPLIVVKNDSPYRSFADFINAAHASPGTLTLGTLGPDSASEMAFEMLKRDTKADITFVPFPGYTPAIQAVLSSTVSSGLADLSTLQGQIQTGKVRALATTAHARVDVLPDVPTVAELGYPGAEAEFFGGVVAPANTPKATVAALIKDFTAAMQSPDIKAKFAALGFYPGGACGADFAAILHKDYDDYGRIIREAKIKGE
jgi:tripartite-type tricarboxylate transporter receptor subunit TctC